MAKTDTAEDHFFELLMTSAVNHGESLLKALRFWLPEFQNQLHWHGSPLGCFTPKPTPIIFVHLVDLKLPDSVIQSGPPLLFVCSFLCRLHMGTHVLLRGIKFAERY